jgi:hypothetical protein
LIIMSQVEYVRVYVEQSGKEISLPKPYAVNAGYPILDKPAVNRYGQPLRDKVRQPLGTPKPAPRKHVPAPQAAPAKADTAEPTTEATKEATK